MHLLSMIQTKLRFLRTRNQKERRTDQPIDLISAKITSPSVRRFVVRRFEQFPPPISTCCSSFCPPRLPATIFSISSPFGVVAEAQKPSKVSDNRSVTATTNSSSLFLAFEPETNSAVNQSFNDNKTEEQNGEGIVPNGKPKTGKWTTAFIQLVMVVLVVGTLLLCAFDSAIYGMVRHVRRWRTADGGGGGRGSRDGGRPP
ncbi:hypothetical protein niasHT_020002 [Heterodera trifolii]|uniref:Uncharacterized protein n=1 Tax=Heterodera trifolii TaxID=157864 RepID=A0ABD2L659_9BILA